MKLGYCTWGMPTVPVDTQIEHVAGLGFDGIELTVIPRFLTDLYAMDAAERKRIKQLLIDHDLDLPAIAGHTRLMETDPDLHAKNLQRLRDTIDLAVEWTIGDAPPALDTTTGGQSGQWETHKEMLAERMGELVEYGASRGVIIAIEPHVADIVDTPAKTIALLEMINSPYLKVNFDISHFDVIGMSIEESVAPLARHSVHTHVKDQLGRAPDHEFLIPGEGNFDYVTYLKSMQKHGYDGYITVEVSVMVQRRSDYDPLAATTLSYQTLERAFRKAGISRQ